MFDVLNRNLRYLFVVNFVFAFSIQLITPLFPLFLSELGASTAENASVISIGALVSTALMLPSGLLIDKIGRKVLLIGSAVVNMISIYMMSQVSTWQQVFPFFILYSISWTLFIPARMAMITANSEVVNRASVFGVMNTSWPIAGVLSPIVSGYIIELMGWNKVFYVGAAVNILGILAGLRIKGSDRSTNISSGRGFTELLGAQYLPTLLIFCVYGIFVSAAVGGVNQIMPLYLDSHYNLSAQQIGLFFTLQSIITLITQIPSGAFADRHGRKRTLITLLIPIPLLLASWHFIHNWWILLVLNSLAMGLWTMTWPSVLSLLSDSVPSRFVGAAFGINMTGNRLGQTIGPVIASYFYVNFVQTSPFLIAGGIFILATTLALRIKETKLV